MYATKQQAGSSDEEEIQTKDEAKPFELLGKKRSRSSGKLGELEMLAKEFAGGGEVGYQLLTDILEED